MNRPLAVLLLAAWMGSLAVVAPLPAISGGNPEIAPRADPLADAGAGHVDWRRGCEVVVALIVIVAALGLAGVIVAEALDVSVGVGLACLLLLPLILPLAQWWGQVQGRGIPGWVLSLHP